MTTDEIAQQVTSVQQALDKSSGTPTGLCTPDGGFDSAGPLGDRSKT